MNSPSHSGNISVSKSPSGKQPEEESLSLPVFNGSSSLSASAQEEVTPLASPSSASTQTASSPQTVTITLQMGTFKLGKSECNAKNNGFSLKRDLAPEMNESAGQSNPTDLDMVPDPKKNKTLEEAVTDAMVPAVESVQLDSPHNTEHMTMAISTVSDEDKADLSDKPQDSLEMASNSSTNSTPPENKDNPETKREKRVRKSRSKLIAAVENQPKFMMVTRRSLRVSKENGEKSPTSSVVSGIGIENGVADLELSPSQNKKLPLKKRQPILNDYQLHQDVRSQVDRRLQQLTPVAPKAPVGFEDYLLNRGTYLLAGNASALTPLSVNIPFGIPPLMVDFYTEQEGERHKLRLQHLVEKEKLVLANEQEILRANGQAARAQVNQKQPYSVCTILKEQEVYNLKTPEEEEKAANAQIRYNGRHLLSWLQDVNDKWDNTKKSMLLRHHHEAESLHAIQKMNWEWKLQELGLSETTNFVPLVYVSESFELMADQNI